MTGKATAVPKRSAKPFALGWVAAIATVALLALAPPALAAGEAVLENEFLRIGLDPEEFAGCVVEFMYKPTGRDLSGFRYYRERGGLGPAEQRTNVGLLWRDAQDVEWDLQEENGRRSVETRYRWAGEIEDVEVELRFTKRFTLANDESRVVVDWSIENIGDAATSIGPWVRNTMDHFGRYYTVRETGPGETTGLGHQFFAPITNWLARTGSEGADKAKEETFFLVVNHTHTTRFFNWWRSDRYGLEAIFAPPTLEPGGRWSTTYVLGVAPGLPNVVWAGPEAAVGMTPPDAAELADEPLQLSIAPATSLGTVDVQARLLRDGEKVRELPARQMDWRPGRVAELEYELNLAPPGRYTLELRLLHQGQPYALGQEVEAYRDYVEIPIIVGDLPEHQATVEPWPRPGMAYPEIEGSDLELPVVAENDAFRIALAHPSQRVFREDRLAEDAEAADAVHKYLARGEWESVPLVVFPQNAQGLTSAWVSVSPLAHTDEAAEIGAEQIRVYRVGHIRTREPSRFRPDPVGRYPDPLLPLNSPVDLAGNQNAGFWINIQAPADAPAGTYTGTIHLYSHEGSAQIPLEVRVWDFELPSPPALRTWAGAVGFGRSSIARQMRLLHAHDYDVEAISQDFNRLTVGYGFSPRRGFSFKNLQQWADHGRGISAFYGGGRRRQGWATPENVRQQGWEGRVYQYAPFDEHADHEAPRVAEWARAFREENPHIKVADVFYGTNTEPLHDVVDVWVRGFQRDDWTRERLDAGDEFWVVNPGIQMIELPLLPRRQNFWRMWSYGYTGALLASVASWHHEDRVPPDYRNIGFNAAYVLLYPIPGGITTSIRWENLRDGLEDYDYLAVLRQRADAPAPGAAEEDVARAREILDDPDLHLRITDWRALEERRLEIGRLIERLGEKDG